MCRPSNTKKGTVRIECILKASGFERRPNVILSTTLNSAMPWPDTT